MSEIRTGPDAADAMASWSWYASDYCLQAVSRAFQYGTPSSPSQVDPLVILNPAGADNHWRHTPEQFKHYDWDPPKGAVVQWLDRRGDRERGHIAISMGGGQIVSTDKPGKGQIGVVGISDITWSDMEYAGWSTWINGRQVEGIGGQPSGTEHEMIVGVVPQGTIALIGEIVARPFTGDEKFIYDTHINAFGATPVADENQMSVLLSEASKRRAEFAALVAGQMKTATVDVDALAIALAPKLGLDPAAIVAAFGEIRVDGALTSDGVLSAVATVGH